LRSQAFELLGEAAAARQDAETAAALGNRRD
jgi:hypothetical protein